MLLGQNFQSSASLADLNETKNTVLSSVQLKMDDDGDVENDEPQDSENAAPSF
jgi:hypothetical protein